jgi:GDPmannose 4,6-dehydratase
MSDLQLHSASLESFASLHRVIRSVLPDECYHLAAQSFVSYSFEDEFSTLNTNINGTHYVLAALHDLAPKCRFYLRVSEMFERVEQVPQNEQTVFIPFGLWHLKVAGFESPAITGKRMACSLERNSLQPRISPARYEFVTGRFRPARRGRSVSRPRFRWATGSEA